MKKPPLGSWPPPRLRAQAVKLVRQFLQVWPNLLDEFDRRERTRKKRTPKRKKQLREGR